jgi:spermidine synthase
MSTENRARPLYLSLFLSGAAGLIYEVVWFRRLSLLLGGTSLALSAVLAAFMGGMALGSRILGPLADREGARPVGLYVLLQFGTMVSALAAFLLPELLQPLSAAAYRSLGTGLPLVLTRFVAAVVVMGVPTVMMGGTLPVLTRALAERKGVGRSVAALYGWNTAGAVAGTAAAGFFMIPGLGLLRTLLAGMVLNALAGGVCMLVRLRRVSPPASIGEAGGGAPAPLAAGFLVGMAVLAAEVLWTTGLVSGIYNNTYAVSTMLVAVLVGIAGGSYWASRSKVPVEQRSPVFLLVMAGWLPLTGLYIRVGTGLVEGMVGPESLSEALLLRYLPVFLVLLPITVSSGMLFPSLSKLYSPRPERSGSGVGRFSAANTLGALVGSVSASFLLLPLVGRRLSLLMLSLVLLVACSVLTRWRRLRTATVLVLMVSVFLSLPGVVSGRVDHDRRVVFRKDTPEGEVLVTQSRDAPSSLRLSIRNSQASTTTPEGCLKNRLMAYFPMLLHPHPENVSVICFGTGITVGTTCMFDNVRLVDCVEINPTVVEAASLFSRYNHDALSDPRVRVVIEDGRNHLLGTRTEYDVITEEPMHPALAGVVSLYSREYYQLCRRRLRRGGVMAQWLPLYDMSPEDCRMVVATFLDVFPRSTMWVLGRDAMLVGGKDWSMDPARVFDGLSREGVAEDLRPFGLEAPERFLASYMMGPRRLRAYAGDAPVVTDDRPLLEYTAPSAVFERGLSAENLQDILELREPPPGADTLGPAFDRAWRAAELFHTAVAARASMDLSRETELLRAAVDTAPEFLTAAHRLSESLHQSSRVLLGRGNSAMAWRLMWEAMRVPGARPSVSLLTDLSVFESALDMWDGAHRHAEMALRREPLSAAATRALARATMGLGRTEEAKVLFDRADSLSVH